MTSRSAASMSYSCDLVDVPLDRGENEVVDVADVREALGDRVRLGEVEPDAARRAADLARGRLRPGLVPARHDHVATFVGIGLRELAAEPLRAADDDDAAVGHSLSPFAAGREGPARASRGPGPVRTALDRCRRLGRPVGQEPALAEDVVPRLVELPKVCPRSASTSCPSRFTALPGDEHRVDVRRVGEDDDRPDRVDHRAPC